MFKKTLSLYVMGGVLSDKVKRQTALISSRAFICVLTWEPGYGIAIYTKIIPLKESNRERGTYFCPDNNWSSLHRETESN